MNKLHAAVGAGTLALGALIVAGATTIRADAGYGGVGPNFLPWVVGLALADHADVAPLFRKNGAACYFGPDLVRAAATRDDCWTPPVLGLLNGLTPEQYRELLDDPDPTARELAAFFLGPFRERFAAERRAKDDEIARLRAELEDTRRRLPPVGTAGKVRWVAGIVAKRLTRRAG